MTQIRRTPASVIALAAAIFLTGCATVDFDYPKVESSALAPTDTTETALGRQVAGLAAGHSEDESGFYVISDGKEALALRLHMMEEAEHTIDAQYFLIYDDLIGRVFANAMLRAANRGVRVRFLLDDVLSKGLDPGLAALDSHENIEVRIYNPFAHRKARGMDAFSLGRITRRMHNKSLTVDNQITLIGGRNIAGEYFDEREDVHFSDLDVMAVGPIVPEVSNSFDTYWNSRPAVPIQALADAPDDAASRLDALEGRIQESLEDARTSIYAEAVKASVSQYDATDSIDFVWAPYDLVYDSPGKSSADTWDESKLITNQIRSAVDAKKELFVVTPYFVLTKDDIEAFRTMREKGVDITVITNSLATNNHSSVYGAYYPTRKPLLQMGVHLYEMRASLDEPADEKLPEDAPIVTLHAKTFTVDRESIFIGSFNWNQRSVNRDTELGVIIHSPELATELVDRVNMKLPTSTFKISLDDKNKTLWTIEEDGQEVVLTKAPQTGAWKRFSAWMARIVPRSQL
jgi:putative cardiolipin synthase